MLKTVTTLYISIGLCITLGKTTNVWSQNERNRYIHTTYT